MSGATGCTKGTKESEREVASQLDRLGTAIQRSGEIQSAIRNQITPILRRRRRWNPALLIAAS